MTRGTDTDAWTYYDFGARSFQDDIRALVLDYLDQTPYGGTIPSQLREQATSRPLPFVPIPLKSVTLESESIYPRGIGGMPKLGLTVKLDQQAETFTHLCYFPELMTKIRDRVAQEIAADLMDAVFSGRSLDGGISALRETAERIGALGPDR